MMESEPRVLVVEDDGATRVALRRTLLRSGFHVVEATTGEEALDLHLTRTFSLIILDLGLPDIDGLEVCRQIRASDDQVPILILTGRTNTQDKVRGLELGADDYLTKPFDPSELVARLHALLRRARRTGAEAQDLQHRGLRLEISRRRCFKEGRELDLTPREFTLLAELLSHPGQALSRHQLTERLWGTNHHGCPKSLDVYIRRLREKVEDNPSQPDLIQTARGVGYLCN